MIKPSRKFFGQRRLYIPVKILSQKVSKQVLSLKFSRTNFFRKKIQIIPLGDSKQFSQLKIKKIK